MWDEESRVSGNCLCAPEGWIKLLLLTRTYRLWNSQQCRYI